MPSVQRCARGNSGSLLGKIRLKSAREVVARLVESEVNCCKREKRVVYGLGKGDAVCPKLPAASLTFGCSPAALIISVTIETPALAVLSDSSPDMAPPRVGFDYRTGTSDGSIAASCSTGIDRTDSTPLIAPIASTTLCATGLSTSTIVYAISPRDLFSML